MTEDNKNKVYKNAWIRLKNEVLNEKTGWGKEDLKKRTDKVLIEEIKVLIEEIERYL